MKTKLVAPTKAQIEAWKKEHNCKVVYKITSEDGKVAYIKDPVSDLKIMKMATTALQKSDSLYVQVVLNQCWLDGDDEIKEQEEYGAGLVNQLNNITEIPNAIITREGSKYIMEVEGVKIEVRAAKRADVLLAEQKNRANEPFETNIHLLDIIKITDIKDIKKDSRVYIGFLAALDDVKNKVAVAVEKL